MRATSLPSGFSYPNSRPIRRTVRIGSLNADITVVFWVMTPHIPVGSYQRTSNIFKIRRTQHRNPKAHHQYTGNLYALSLSMFLFHITRITNILSAASTEAAAQTHWVARAVSLTRPTILISATTNYSHSYCITQKIRGHLYISLFMRFRYTRRLAAMRITSVTFAVQTELLDII
jgi:hypothetical protein